MNQVTVNNQTDLHGISGESDDVRKSANYVGGSGIPMEVKVCRGTVCTAFVKFLKMASI